MLSSLKIMASRTAEVANSFLETSAKFRIVNFCLVRVKWMGMRSVSLASETHLGQFLSIFTLHHSLLCGVSLQSKTQKHKSHVTQADGVTGRSHGEGIFTAVRNRRIGLSCELLQKRPQNLSLVRTKSPFSFFYACLEMIVRKYSQLSEGRRERDDCPVYGFRPKCSDFTQCHSKV